MIKLSAEKFTDLKPRPRTSGGGEPPDMDARLRHLETEVAIIRETIVTRDQLAGEIGSLRAEMHSLLRQQTMWSVGTIIAMAGLVFAIVQYSG